MTNQRWSRPIPFEPERRGAAEPRRTPYWPVDALRDEIDDVDDAAGNVRLEQWTRRIIILSGIAIVLLYLFLLRN